MEHGALDAELAGQISVAALGYGITPILGIFCSANLRLRTLVFQRNPRALHEVGDVRPLTLDDGGEFRRAVADRGRTLLRKLVLYLLAGDD